MIEIEKMKPNTLTYLIPLFFIMLLSVVSCSGQKIKDYPVGRTDIHKMLYYASLAGSSHNTQPWKAEVIADDSLLVFADTSRLLDVVDPKGIELYISVGAFIENFDIAADALGYKACIKLFETGINTSLPVAGIKLTKTGLPPKPEELKALQLRTTLRIPFDTTPIIKSDLDRLVIVAPQNISFVPSNSPNGQVMAQKELEAYTIQAYQKDAQNELASWMRFSNKDVNTKRDGLTPAGMGLKGFAGFVVRNFMKPEDSKKESFIKSGIEKTQKQVENCGGWILISTEKEHPVEWINIGRIYERINIQCRSMGLGFHPMNQIVEMPSIHKELNEKIVPGRTIRFIARIGYVHEYPAPVSKRRSVESFTVFK